MEHKSYRSAYDYIRCVTPCENAVISIGEFKAGEAANIIADKAYMSASIRSIKEDDRQMIAEKVKQVIEHVCKVYDAEPNLNYIFSYPPVINHEAIAKLVMDSGAEVLGCGEAADGCGYINHHPKFRIQEAAFISGVKTELQAVKNFLR